MSDFIIIIFLFPIFFMIHEFEEIIMIQKWINHNQIKITQRFPHLYPIIKKASKIDTHKFSIIVAEEFIIVSTCCTISIYYRANHLLVLLSCGIQLTSPHSFIAIYHLAKIYTCNCNNLMLSSILYLGYIQYHPYITISIISFLCIYWFYNWGCKSTDNA